MERSWQHGRVLEYGGGVRDLEYGGGMRDLDGYRPMATPGVDHQQEGAEANPYAPAVSEEAPSDNLKGLLLGIGVVLFVGGLAAAQWGASYVREKRFGEALSELLGHGSGTYELAQNAMGVGSIAGVLGVVMLLIGLLYSSRSTSPSGASRPIAATDHGTASGSAKRFCPQCGMTVDVAGAVFCESCGARLREPVGAEARLALDPGGGDELRERHKATPRP
jgi:hypothetical protein